MASRQDGLLILIITSLSFLETGSCVVVSSSPANNTQVVHFIGTANVTFECFAVDENGNRTPTFWNIRNFRRVEMGQSILLVLNDTTRLEGDSTNGTEFFPTFRTRLTFLTFLEDFHLATLTCGSRDFDPFSVLFPLRVYGPPNLAQSRVVRFQEGTRNVEVNLETGQPALPFPEFVWTKDGQAITNSSGRVFGYPSLTISSVFRSDSGVYSLSATNFVLDDPTRQVGSGTGSFTLDVVFGPGVIFGPVERVVRLGDPLELVCGTGLVSNPPAIVIWRDPNGFVVTDTPRYDFINDEAGVRLLFTHTISEDTGTWTCEVRVDGVNVTTEGGVVTDILVGRREHTIALSVVEPPGQPGNLTVEEIGATWVVLSWQPPQVSAGLSAITRYNVLATNTVDGLTIAVSTPDATTRMNVTGLLPNSQYEFRVLAIALVIDFTELSMLSFPVRGSTSLTVPDLMCTSASVIEDGYTRIKWTFLHTGGQPLANLLVNYFFKDGQANMTVLGPEVSTEDRMVDIPPLVVGFHYVAMVTASNSNHGSTVAVCPGVDLEVGIPQDPELPVVMELEAGSVVVTVRTLASGLEPGGVLTFILTQTLNSTQAPNTVEHTMFVDNYRNGERVEFRIDGLEVGALYTFAARVMNRFGSSGSVTATRLTGVTSTSSFSGTVAVVVISCVMAVLILFTTALFTILLVLVVARKCSPAARAKSAGLGEGRAAYEDVDVQNEGGTTRQSDPTYMEVGEGTIELKENAAYKRIDSAQRQEEAEYEQINA